MPIGRPDRQFVADPWPQQPLHVRRIVRRSRNLQTTTMFFLCVTPRRARLLEIPRTLAVAALVLLALGLAAPATTLAATKTKTVRYHGVSLTVPSNWPVFRLSPESSVCVRFNRHAVYLGQPGTQQDCPAQAAGRTEAILISPAQGANSGRSDEGPAPVSTLAAAPAGGSMVRVARPGQHVVITATWNHDPAAIQTALRIHSLRAAMLATNGHRPVAMPVTRAPRLLSRQSPRLTPATPGGVDTGLGFDICNAPSASQMAAWTGTSPYNAIGIYIGGADAACPWGNLSQSWVSSESAAGWHLVPIYVGLQAPGNGCGCSAMSSTPTDGQYTTAASQGTAAALDAVAQAQALGIGPGNPLYFDMENYTRKSAATGPVLAFLQAWTTQLHASGYLSGVYASGSSGITDLVSQQGTTYLEPDEIWVADWSSSSSYVPTNADDPYLPSTDWVNNQRLIQYYGGKAVSYGGVKLTVDSDYLDGATAAFGSGPPVGAQIAPTPSVAIRPQANGSVNLTPSWAGEPGISTFQILGGNSQTAMTPIESVSANRSSPVSLQDLYAYFEVQALNVAGQVVGSSAPTQTPASVAIFGNSAFIAANGAVGIPVSCPNATSCQVQATIYDGKRRLAQTQGQAVPIRGGLARFTLAKSVYRLATQASDRRLPITVDLSNSTGPKASRSLNLVPFTTAGAAPARHVWSSSMLRILGTTSFVSNGWVGGVLVACTSKAPCVTTTHLTRAGATIASPRTQTLGAGEIGYLAFTLNAKGHASLKASKGNQYGARVTVTTGTAPGAVGVAAASGTAMALVSLDSYR
jgi:hypothetical protein